MKTCPFCAEEVQDAAIVCKHCGRDLKVKTKWFLPFLILILVLGLAVAWAQNQQNLQRREEADLAAISGNEASAIGSLRAINSAQAMYAASCGFGFYASTLVNLGTPPTVGAGNGFIGIALAADPAFNDGYTITMTGRAAAAGARPSCNGGTVVTTYSVSATPTDGRGVRHFSTNQGGTVYQSDSEIPVTQVGAPAGAEPIQ